jgi:hypothetical protein
VVTDGPVKSIAANTAIVGLNISSLLAFPKDEVNVPTIFSTKADFFVSRPDPS